MKKILVVLVTFFYLFSLNVSAYSIVNVSNNSIKYEADFKKKIDFSKIKIITLKKLIKKIETLVNNTETNTKLSDEKKEMILWKLIALSNMINKELNNRENSIALIVTVIDDKRCTNCMTKEIVTQLKLVPFLFSANYVEREFSETWVVELLKLNWITKLPAVILSTNKLNDDWQMQPYLKELNDKQYSLEIGASFDPFMARSEKWFLVLDKETLNKIKSNTFLKGNKDAKISWIEYSDLECPFCAKLHNSDVSDKLKETYWDEVNKYFNNYPLEFHQNAMPAARIVECLAEQKWSNAFYNLLDIAFTNEKSDRDFLITEAVKLWADKTKLEKCVTDWKYDEKILEQQTTWNLIFWITWTPANVLVNNITGEYEVLSWAVPFTSFKTTIDALLK